MLKNLLNLMFPKTCKGCDALLLYNEVIICNECRHKLPLTQHHLIKNNSTFKKFYGIIPTEFCSAMLYFHKDGIVQNLIHNLKYKNCQEIGTLLGDWYSHEIKHVEELKDVTDIIPVPLHKKRFKERGYNQITTFCQSLAENLQVKFNEELLHRNSYSKTQTKKNKTERNNISNAIFEISHCYTEEKKHFLLVDDVITSGATLEACAKTLLKIPNSKISIITIAYSDS